MDNKLKAAMEEFITQRINDLGADAPAAVTDAVSEAEEQKERLVAALSIHDIGKSKYSGHR